MSSNRYVDAVNPNSVGGSGSIALINHIHADRMPWKNFNSTEAQ